MPNQSSQRKENFSVKASSLKEVSELETYRRLLEMIFRASSTISPEEYEDLVGIIKTASVCFHSVQNEFSVIR